MKRKIMTGFLALVLVLQAFIPSFAYALEEKPKDNKLITKKLESPDSNFITIGKLKGVGFSKDNPTASISVEEVEQKNNHKKEALGGLEIGGEIVPRALRSTKSPYIKGQQPADPDKPKYWTNVQGKLTTVGIDGTTFDWNKVLGKGAKVKLLFTQTNGNVMTGVRFYLEVDKDGTYTWHGSDGNPTYLPLYDVDGNSYTYNVQIERNFSENVQLIIQESNGTPGVSWRPEGDKQVATISFLDIEIQQLASTKFVSEWHTGLDETDRPQIEGYFKVEEDVDNDFNFPKNNTARTILRSSFLENFVEDEDNGPWAFISSELETTPETVEVKTDTQGLTFEEADGVKTVKSGDHKFKYDFTYDVIEGGKLTMTEILPVTFDANGGKYESITDENAEQKIAKEVEYDKDLTDKVEEPKKDLETFKGWATEENGTPLSEEDFKAAIKNIKEAKTFYAIWDNNEITADELEVKESFKDGDTWVNDFIPTLDTLKGQVKIKDASGDLQTLTDEDTIQILDDSGNPIADGDLKDKLYEKLKEDDATEVSRKVELKARVTFANGKTKEVTIPIKVIKNIYEAKTKEGKPIYVPEGYVKVTLDPTTKATDPQKTYYYVNPDAKVLIPGTNPTGTGDNVFIKWLIDGTDTEYKLIEKPRHQFSSGTTIKAQYEKQGKGIIKISYVDGNGKEIDPKYHKDGQDYPDTKEGKLNSYALDKDFSEQGPDFEGYIFNTRESIKGKRYKDSADPAKLDTVTYTYYKKVTTKEPKNPNIYFKVIFDANSGEFESDPKDKKTVYVYFDGNNATVEKVTFKEVKDEFDKAYSSPTKDGFDFKEWQNAKTNGTKPAYDYEIQFKGWDSTTYTAKEEIFYAHYEKAGALISYLDLDGKAIADDFKIDGVEYPTEKEGKADKAIAKNVFTADTAPKFTGYKFNRIELNPANGKYALDNKATIKIYYEKLDDIIPSTGNDKPDGYVTVTFEPGTNGTLDGETKFYVNPAAGKKNSDLTEPTIKAKTGFTVADKKWAPDFVADTEIKKDATYTAQYTDGKDVIPVPDPANPPYKPDGYVTVKFDLDGKGTTTDTKEFYVNPNKEVEITAPTVTGINNYSQKTGDEAWNPTFAIKAKYTEDKTFVAQYDFTKDIVPQGPGEDKPVVPDNYVKVTFKEGDHGIISASQTTIYWVNPDKVVDLTDKVPKVKADLEYKHTGWDKELKAQFKEATDITAKYLKKVETTNPNDTENYVKVDFVAKDHGKIKAGETSVYWVLKDETVELKTPAVEVKTNYAFKEWDPEVKTSYRTDTSHKAVFAYTGDNVVPQTGEEKPDVPDNFVEVVFVQGDHGTIAADVTTTYWVNPKAEVTVTAPKVTPNEDYKHVAWAYGTKEETNLQSVTDTFTENKTLITAKYLKKVLGEEPQTDRDAYVKVTFKAEANGKLADDKTEKSYWVLKDTPVALTAPSVTVNAGWKFIKYEPAVQDSYSEDTEHKAQYKKIIETKDPKDKDYVKVTFDPAAQGTIKTGSNAEVWVLKDETIDPTAITPQLEVKTGYAFKEWTPAVQTSYSEDTKHVASYTYNGDDVVPQKPGEDKPNVPNNFVKVTFVAGEHGSIANTETYIFWVNPKKEVTLNDPNVMSNADYKHVAWNYGTKEETNLQSVTDTFANETTITAKYLEKVVTEDPNDKENYVKVTFVAGDNGTIASTETTTYWVLKKTDVTINGPKVTPNSGYTFTEWSPAVKTNYDADTTHTAQYKLKDKVLTEDPNDIDYIKVTFDANGGKIGTEDTKDVWVLKDIATFADAKAKVATPIKEKATFKEWQDKASEGKAVEGTKVLSTANETFYAAYTDYDKIIEDPTTPEPNPGYVRLTFDATSDGRIGDANGQQKKVIDVLKGTPYTDTDLKARLDGIKAIPVKDEGGNAVADKEKTFDMWTPAVPTTGYVKTETFTASYKNFIPEQVKIDITATKTWQDAEGNTPNFTTPEVKFELWRKAGQDGTEEIVKEATALTSNSVTFSGVDKYDANGVKYIYFVKEVFTNPAEKENWTVSGEGTLNLTNKLKGDSTDPGTDKGGRLTITKKLENEPVVLKAFSMMRAPAPAASEPLKFSFKVTGPYGYEKTFELAANESKTLDKLAYGEYTVKETDTKGYTPEYSKTKETLTKENPIGSITVTNKNIIPGENETNDNIIDVTVTKVWVGGEKPATEIQLWRTGYGLNGKVFQEKVDSFTTTANGADTQTHKFEKLAKQDPSGKVFTYYAEEVNVPANYTASYSDDNLTVTNRYKAPAKEYTVTYKAGSPAATGIMNPVTVAENTNYTVLANGFTNDGYTFKGWKLGNGSIVQPGDTINVTDNVTLTAQWDKTTTPPTPDKPDNPNPEKPDPRPDYPDYPERPDYPEHPDRPYISRYPEVRYETIIQEKIVKVPMPISDDNYFKEVRYMQGFKKEFRPYDGLTRAEAAQILANALVEDGYKYNPNFKISYKDVGEAWYTRAVKIVTEARVFEGYDDGNFKPQGKITRNEWIATLKRFQELGDASGNDMKLRDNHWAKAEIQAAFNEGWLKIYTDGLATYKGDEFIPRQEVAAVSNKAFNRIVDKTYIGKNNLSLVTYKDVNPSMWAYEDILCASNTFLDKKDLYRAHWVKEDKNQFNINTSDFVIVQKNFQRNPR